MAKIEVAFVRVTDVDNNGEIVKGVDKIIKVLGGLEKFVARGDKVVVKPNFIVPRPSNTGTTTDPRIIEEIIVKLKDVGAKPLIVEGSGLGYNTQNVFKALGINAIAKKLSVELIDARRGPFSKIKVPNGRIFGEIAISKYVAEADAIVNLPKMKTHTDTTVTLGIKNLKGFLPDNLRRRAHVFGLGQALADLAKALHDKVKLIIIDGLWAMQGMGPCYGELVKTGVLIGSNNLIAADVACCRIMGVSETQIEHVKLAKEAIAPLMDVSFSGDANVSIKSFMLPPRPTTKKRLISKMDYLTPMIMGTNLYTSINKLLKKKPNIVRDKCIQCGLCLKVCLTNAINIENREINHKYCDRCYICIEFCPKHAITKS